MGDKEKERPYLIIISHGSYYIRWWYLSGIHTHHTRPIPLALYRDDHTFTANHSHTYVQHCICAGLFHIQRWQLLKKVRDSTFLAPSCTMTSSFNHTVFEKNHTKKYNICSMGYWKYRDILISNSFDSIKITISTIISPSYLVYFHQNTPSFKVTKWREQIY